jgi:protein-S-isoprenylcysteine O-methyltransferase Ste14
MRNRLGDREHRPTVSPSEPPSSIPVDCGTGELTAVLVRSLRMRGLTVVTRRAACDATVAFNVPPAQWPGARFALFLGSAFAVFYPPVAGPADMPHRTLTLARITAFALTLLLWRWTLHQSFPPALNAVCVVGTVVGVVPTAWIGRRALDVNPTTEHAARVTTVVHAILMVLFGIAIIKGIRTGDSWRGVVVPIPEVVGTALAVVTGAFTLVTVVNLALRGLGAPFAIALSRRLAMDWLYAWTRNPMVLGVIAWLMSVGLRLQSLLFVVWVVVLVAPAWIVFLKMYEERELEIRFGDGYREYKARTPFLWPRRPRA